MDYSLLGNNVLKDHRRPTSRAFRDVGLGTLERTRYLPKNRGGFHIGGRHRAKASAIESCTGCNSSPPATPSPSPPPPPPPYTHTQKNPHNPHDISQTAPSYTHRPDKAADSSPAPAPRPALRTTHPEELCAPPARQCPPPYKPLCSSHNKSGS